MSCSSTAAPCRCRFPYCCSCLDLGRAVPAPPDCGPYYALGTMWPTLCLQSSVLPCAACLVMQCIPAMAITYSSNLAKPPTACLLSLKLLILTTILKGLVTNDRISCMPLCCTLQCKPTQPCAPMTPTPLQVAELDNLRYEIRRLQGESTLWGSVIRNSLYTFVLHPSLSDIFRGLLTKELKEVVSQNDIISTADCTSLTLPATPDKMPAFELCESYVSPGTSGTTLWRLGIQPGSIQCGMQVWDVWVGTPSRCCGQWASGGGGRCTPRACFLHVLESSTTSPLVVGCTVRYLRVSMCVCAHALGVAAYPAKTSAMSVRRHTKVLANGEG